MTMTASSALAQNHRIISPSDFMSPSSAANSASTGNQKNVNGTVDSMINGAGTFSKAMEEVNGVKTIDKTVMYANGKSKSTEKTVTINDDGSKTISKTGKNGKTSTIQETVTSLSDGTRTTVKDRTNANGVTSESTSSISKNPDGSVDHQVTRTNAKGQTETLDRLTTRTDGSRSVVTTGTGYNGNPIYNETTWTMHV